MIPLTLVFGFAAGMASGRIRTLALAILALGITWACLIAVSVANDLADVLGAFALGAANALVGALAGAAIRLLAVGVSRLRPTA